MTIQDISIPKSAVALADDTTLEASGGKLQIKNDGVTALKVDVVGLDGATGKVNTINTTNFSSLDGVNLTNIGDLVKIETVNLSGGASKTLDSSTLDLSSYKSILIMWNGSVATASETLRIIINDDTTGGNYSMSMTLLESDSHASNTNNGYAWAGVINTNSHNQGHIFINLADGMHKALSGVGGKGDYGAVITGTWEVVDAITKITLSTNANNMNTNMEMTIYGIK